MNLTPRKKPLKARAKALTKAQTEYMHLCAAVFSLSATPGDVDGAVRKFKKVVPKPWPKNLKRFIANKQDRIANGDIVLPFRRTPRRSSKLSDEQAMMAAKAFLQGTNRDGYRRLFWDYKEVRRCGGRCTH